VWSGGGATVLQVASFRAGERESDQHVLTYNWLAPNVRQVPPAFYAVLKCPTCHFADLREDFQTPSENPFNRRMIKAFKSAGQKDKLIMELLARHIQYPDLDFGSALNLHFLALYAQMLLPAESCDTYKIARLLLRVAWLYRENTPDEEGNLQLPTVDEIQKNLTAFENQLYQARTESERVSAGLRQRATELSDTFDGKEGVENPYQKSRIGLTRQFESLLSEIYQIKRLLHLDLRGELESGAQEETAFFTFPSYHRFFERLKGVWPFAPADEKEAILLSIAYFERCVATDPAFEDPEKYFSAIKLITDLMLRTGNLEGAYTMVRSIYKTASDTRQRFQRELRENKELQEHEKKILQTRIERTAVSIEQAGQLRHLLLNRFLERDRAKIETILAENPDADLETLERLLIDDGYPRR
jgi:CTP-dependent riboflavin kinase